MNGYKSRIAHIFGADGMDELHKFIEFCLQKLGAKEAECVDVEVEGQEQTYCYCEPERSIVTLARSKGSEKLDVAISDVDRENEFVIHGIDTVIAEGITLSKLEGEEPAKVVLDNVNPITVMATKDGSFKALLLYPTESFRTLKERIKARRKAR